MENNKLKEDLKKTLNVDELNDLFLKAFYLLPKSKQDLIILKAYLLVLHKVIEEVSDSDFII